MIQCQICQHENPQGAEYCENCGASLSSSHTPASSQAPAPTAPAAPTRPQADVTVPEMVIAPADSAPAAAPPTPDLTSSAPAAPLAEAAPPATPAATQGAPAAPPTPAPPTHAAGRNARLVANRYGAPSGEEYPLLGERLIVGRFDPETGPVDVDLSQAPEAPQLSRRHAELYREGGAWFVQDLGSTNGVFVKPAGKSGFGPRITAPQPLSNGDEVAFGNARFILRAE